jgi:5,5'-dehydrodivanillate O-demethylase
MNHDFLAWVGQGTIADRTQEHLGASDKGIVMIRRRFFEEMDRIAAGGEAKGIIRDPAQNQCVELPVMERDSLINGYSTAEILADPRKRLMSTSYIFQAGQPEEVRQQFVEAMGLPAMDFAGLPPAKK